MKNKQNEIQEELRIIEKQHGILRPVDVVEYARNPKTALHAKFEWDNKKAGHEFRLWQARELIRVHVTIVKNTSTAMRCYVSLERDRKQRGGGYRSIQSVMSDQELRNELLEMARCEMLHFKRKYAGLKELATVFAEMDKVESQIKMQKAKRPHESIVRVSSVQ